MLNERQLRFCHLLFEGHNRTTAYAIAYNKETDTEKKRSNIRTYASKLYNNVEIQQYLKDIVKEEKTTTVASSLERMTILTNMMRSPLTKDSDKISAIKELNTMTGEYLKDDNKDVDIIIDDEDFDE